MIELMGLIKGLGNKKLAVGSEVALPRRLGSAETVCRLPFSTAYCPLPTAFPFSAFCQSRNNPKPIDTRSHTPRLSMIDPDPVDRIQIWGTIGNSG